MSAISFFISSIIIVIIPGTGVIFTISTGITKGTKASVFAALGCTAGIIPHLCLSVILSSFMMKLSGSVFNVIKIAGALYLLYLGVGMIISKTKLTVDDSDEKTKISSIIRQAVLINLLNPKLTIFFFAFLPQYANSSDWNYVIQCIVLGMAFMLLTLIVFIIYGLLAGTVKKFIDRSPKILNVMQKCFGIIFVLFALQLAVYSIN